MAKMRAARMYGYKQPLTLGEIPIPDIEPTEVLAKVGGAGKCRTDFQLIDGYFHSNLPMELPATPGTRSPGPLPASAQRSRQRRGCQRAIGSSASARTADTRSTSRLQKAIRVSKTLSPTSTTTSTRWDALTIRLSRNDRNHE